MTTKFFEEFTMRSNGEFPMLKFNSATYYKEKRELQVKFIISAFEIQSFDDAMKDKVLDLLKEMFNGISVSVQYIRTYADQSVVKNKILEFFNRQNQMIFRRISDDSLSIDVGEHDIDVKFTFDTPTYKILTAGDLLDKLKDYLDSNFNYNIDILTEEIVQELDELVKDEDLHIETTTIANDSGLRLVELRQGAKIYARGKMDGVSSMPNYIADIKGACDNVILCGKITGIEKKSYKNKKYDPANPKTGAEMLPMVKFYIDDSTERMECVCFPSKEEDADKIAVVSQGSDVVCMGKVSWSQFAGSWSYMVSAIFEADINYDSIHLQATKPVPDKYVTIKPQKYVDTTQKTLLDAEKQEGIPAISNKPRRKSGLLDAEKQEGIPANMIGKTYVVFDLETTSLMTDVAEIIEIAALKVVDGVFTESFETLVKPVGPITQEITDVTHITNAMVLDSPNIESVMPDFFKFASNSILVGHNIKGYDFPIINRIAGDMGYKFDNELMDTLLLSRKYFKDELNQFSLTTLSKHFGIEHENAHRALSDVVATAEVLKILSRRM